MSSDRVSTREAGAIARSQASLPQNAGPSALQGHVADLVKLHASHPEAAKTMLHATVIALKAARAAAKP